MATAQNLLSMPVYFKVQVSEQTEAEWGYNKTPFKQACYRTQQKNRLVLPFKTQLLETKL
ncbi:MAG: hypothetical protein V5788_05015 [Shewanella sp.]